MPISINGTGSITGLSAGGLPDNSIVTADIADSAVTTGKLAQPLTLATAQNSTSGTAIDFTGIPSWAKRITVMFNGVSVSGTSVNLIQIGSGNFTISGYLSYHSITSNGASPTTGVETSGFSIWNGNQSELRYVLATIANISSNNWIYSHSGGAVNSTNYYTLSGGGSVSLSGTIDRLRITTVNGTDTFDAGSINIMYEG